MEAVNNQWKRRVYLRGEAGDLFGEVWDLVVRTPAEAVRAIMCNRPKFRGYLQHAHEHGVGFELFLVNENTGERKQLSAQDQNDIDDLVHPMGKHSLEIRPAVMGGGGKVGLIIVGVLLVVVAAVLTFGAGGIALAAFEAGFIASIGGVITATAAISTVGLIAGAVGVALLAQGVSSLLAPTPETSPFDSQASTAPSAQIQSGGIKGRSSVFGGAVNTIGQGRPVPLLFGELIVGSQVVSVSIKNVRTNSKGEDYVDKKKK